MSPSSEDTPDLAELYPIDFNAWRDRPTADFQQAVLLSLAIDPDAVEEAAQLERLSSFDTFGFLEPTEAEAAALSYGQQHGEFIRRLDALRHARRNGSLPSQSGAGVEVVRLAEFVRWARGRDWELPQGLIDLVALPEQNMGRRGDALQQPSGASEDTNEKWVRMRDSAFDVVQRNPSLFRNKSRVAALAAEDMRAQNPDWSVSDSYVRNCLFYKEPPLISEDEWRRLGNQARRQGQRQVRRRP